MLTALLIATGLSAVTTPFAGHISDLIGHKRMYLIGAVVMGLYSFIYFALLNTAIPAVIFIAIILSFIPHDMMYGPQAALIAEVSVRACATAVHRSVTTSPRSSRAGQRRSSRPRCWPRPALATRSHCISSPVQSSA